MNRIVMFLTIFLLSIQLVGQNAEMLCDNSTKYEEFAFFLKNYSNGFDNSNEKKTCIFYYKIYANSSNEGIGFYSLTSSEIHSKKYLFVELDNGKREYLKLYDFSSFYDFILIYIDAVVPEELKCEMLLKLSVFLCDSGHN